MESYITPKHQEACVAAIKQIVSYPSVCHEGKMAHLLDRPFKMFSKQP